MISRLAVLVLVIAPAAHGAGVVAVAGHGGLTAGVDDAAVLSVLRSPDPGGPDQLFQPRAGTIDGGGRWGIDIGSEIYWLGDGKAQVVEPPVADARGVIRAVIAWTDSDLRASVTYYVARDRPALVSDIEVSGCDAAPVLRWRSEWAPRTHLVPELPFADGAFDSINGFAAVIDSGRAWHFRPRQPDRQMLADAAKLAAATATLADWSALAGDGIWIGVGGGERAGLGGGGDAIAALGPIASIVEPRVESRDGAYHASITIAVDTTFEGARAALDATRADSAPVPQPAPLPERLRELPADRRIVLAPHWRLLQTLRDPAGGRAVRGLNVDPPLARDWPRIGARIALAFDAWGDAGAAQSILDHYLAAVRKDDAPGQPYGSMAESFYTNGEIASPPFIVDDLGPARVLYATWRHAQRMAPADRDAWLARHAEAIDAAAEFLSTWADARRGAPLWSKDPTGLADTATQIQVFDHLAGITAAIRLREMRGQPIPQGWQLRSETLLDLAEWIMTTPSAGWSPGPAVVWELDGFSRPLQHATANAARAALPAETNPGVVLSLAIQLSQIGEETGSDAVWQAVARAVPDMPLNDAEASVLVLLAAQP